MNSEDLIEIKNEIEDHLKHGRFRMALASAQDAYAANSSDPRLSSLLAFSFLENLMPDKALEYINLAVELDPENQFIRKERAYILNRLSIYQGALTDLNFISEKSSPENVSLLKAEALAGLHRFDEALSVLKNLKENKEISFFKNLLEIAIDMNRVKDKALLKHAEEAYEKKQHWFSLIASEELIKRKKFLEESSLLKLKSLTDSFQINKGLDYYYVLGSLSRQENFRTFYNKILRIKKNTRSGSGSSVNRDGTSDQKSVIEDKVLGKNSLTALDNFIGLKSLKDSIRNFVSYLAFVQERKSAGLKTEEEISFHCLFLGNPGTGKTSAARVLGGILKQIGVLEKGHVVEVDRAQLVGQYIGETAQKTEKIINDSVGGILFIDEAYTLKKKGITQDFGQEAIDILLKRMEDMKGEFIVIAAGYPDEMTSFIESNPGLQSRFSNTFYFEDFEPEELFEIFKRTSAAEDFKIEDEAEKLLFNKFTELYNRRDKSFGNARLVKNLFGKIKLQISKRYLDLPEKTRNQHHLTSITKEDVEKALQTNEKAYTAEESFLIIRNKIAGKGYEFSKIAEQILIKFLRENPSLDDKQLQAVTNDIIKEHLLYSADLAENDNSKRRFRVIDENAVKNAFAAKEAPAGSHDLAELYLNRIDELVGIEDVKSGIKSQINSLRIREMRKKRGLNTIDKNLNAAFIGSSGTGKTTVARLLGKIYKEMEVLPKGHLIEVDASSFAKKHSKIFAEAEGGILHIENAFELLSASAGEAFEVSKMLIKKLEENPGDFIIILSGEKEEAEQLLSKNPAVKTLLANIFYFEDFTPRQLLEISYIIAERHGYQLDEGAWQQMLEIFIDLFDAKSKNFGNAKAVKNILYEAVSYQEERVLKLSSPTDEVLSTITLDDVQKIKLSEILY